MKLSQGQVDLADVGGTEIRSKCGFKTGHKLHSELRDRGQFGSSKLQAGYLKVRGLARPMPNSELAS